MKKMALSLLCILFVLGVSGQESSKKWELKLGYEQPVSLKSNKSGFETYRWSPRGASARGLYEVWKDRLSVGVALGFNEFILVYEDNAQVDSDGYIITIMDNFNINNVMFKRYYADAVVRFNAINRKGFLLSLSASGGYQYSNNRISDFTISGPSGQYMIQRTVLTDVGSTYNVMVGAEVGYEIVRNLLVTAEYKYDIRHTMHLLGLGVNLKL
jgi:hypothetical protein